MRVGAQRPRLSLLPDGIVSSAADEAIALAETCGMKLDDWQRWCLHYMLGERADGSWAAGQSVLLVPRQAGKSALFEVMILAGLYLFGERRVIYSAHLTKSASDIMSRVVSLVKANPDLESVTQFYFANGKERIERTDTGAVAEFVTRGRKTLRGGSPNRVIFDEALFLTDAQIQAMLPGMSAQSMNEEGAPQFVFGSSAPLPDSEVLHRLRSAAISGRLPRAFYAEWSCEIGADASNRDNWYAANPGLGVRISEDWVADMEYAVMSPDAFAIERLGVVFDPSPAGRDRVISEADWLANATEDAAGTPVAFGLDVSPDRSTACIGAASADGHIGVVDHRPGLGLGWVRDRVAELRSVRPDAVWVIDGRSAANGLLDGEPTVLAAREMAAACGALYDAVMERRVRFRRQSSLEDAVACASRRPLGDAWAWGRRESGGDISPLVAVTLALHGASVPVQHEPLVIVLGGSR